MQATSTSMDTDDASTSEPIAESPSTTPEVEMYSYVLTLLYLSDTKQWELVRPPGCGSTPWSATFVQDLRQRGLCLSSLLARRSTC